MEVRLQLAVQGGRLLPEHPPVHRQQVGHGQSRDDARQRSRHRSGPRIRHVRFPDHRPEAVPQGSRGLDHELPARRVRRHHALAHRQRVCRCAGVRRRFRCSTSRAAIRSSARRCCRSSIRSINAKYGLEVSSFIVENVSVPPEVEQAIDKRSSMAAVGNLNDYVKFQMAQGMEKGGGSGGAATELAVGLSIAQQIMQQQGLPSATAAAAAASDAVALPDLLATGGRGQGARRHGSGRHGDHRVRRAGRQEDRFVVPHKRARSTSIWRMAGLGKATRYRPLSVEPGSQSADVTEMTVSALAPTLRRCGAQAEWDPSTQLLVCPFCGTSRAVHVDAATGAVEELDLVKALREIPDEDADGRQRSAPSSARAARPSPSSIPGAWARTATSADRRRSSTTRDQGADPSAEPPAFKITRRPRSRADPPLVCGQWLAPGALKRRALVDRVHGIYIRTGRSTRMRSARGPPTRALLLHDRDLPRQSGPDAAPPGPPRTMGARTPAKSGTSSTTSPFRERRASRMTCWQGWSHFPRGARAVQHRICPSGFVVEHYQIVLADAAQRCQAAMTEQLRQMCAAQVPGDTHRNLHIRPTFPARPSSTFSCRSGC